MRQGGQAPAAQKNVFFALDFLLGLPSFMFMGANHCRKNSRYQPLWS
jgi:hypothetical protein